MAQVLDVFDLLGEEHRGAVPQPIPQGCLDAPTWPAQFQRPPKPELRLVQGGRSDAQEGPPAIPDHLRALTVRPTLVRAERVSAPELSVAEPEISPLFTRAEEQWFAVGAEAPIASAHTAETPLWPLAVALSVAAGGLFTLVGLASTLVV